MKKGICLILTLILALAMLVTACAEPATFTGTARGMQGDVVVNVTIDGDKITAIEYEKYPETENITKVARDRIPAQIIDHQTLSVDTVTGATFASYAIVNAVKNAVKASGLDVPAMTAEPYHEPAGPDEEWETDVLVMGGGGAGLAAAITAAEGGASVILIEKSSVFGGNTMVAGAAYNAVDPDAQSIMLLTRSQKDTLDGYLAISPDDPALKFDQFPEWKDVLEQLKKDIQDFYAANEGKTAGVDMPGFDSVALHMWHCYTGGLREMLDGSYVAPRIELARTLAENALDSFKWMDSIGLNASFGKEAAYGGYPGLGTVLGAMWPRTHSFMSGAERIPQLIKVAEEKGVKLYTETRGTALLQDDTGRVVGATAETATGTKITIHTKNGVVLATGGYCANPAMVKEYDNYWGDDLTAHTLSTNLGTNEGDGIVMATAIGADTFGMGVAQMMPSSSPVKGTMTDGIWADAAEQIWIDGNGDRFVNEYAERDVLAKASLALDKGIFYIIYAGRGDISKPDQMLTGTPYDARVAGMVEGGHIWYGSTLKELAEASATAAAGCTPAFTEEKLRETIEKYNQYVLNQKDEDFGKEVLAGAIDLAAVEADPDMGICISPRKASLHHTMGGICIDTDTRVLRQDGTVIEGLWAAGEVTGGIHAGNRLGGNAIADIFTFGRIAGQQAADAAK
ncbi:MAG: FAD-dependent oxidoreductase [Clostridia bacterium]|nr:FAD-dependent oxidoreductase [Clostridia bacterium]